MMSTHPTPPGGLGQQPAGYGGQPPQGYPQTQGGPGYPGAHNYSGGPPPSNSKTPLLIAGVVVLLALLGAAVFLLSNADDYAPSDYAPVAAAPTAADPSTDVGAQGTSVPATPPPTQTVPPPAPTATPAAAPSQPRAASPGGSYAVPAYSGPSSGVYSGNIDATGTHRICHLYERTSVPRFKGMSVCYDVTFDQHRDGSLTGQGIKTVEYAPDGTETYLPASGQSPIEMGGYINERDEIHLEYNVQGAQRRTQGVATYTWAQRSEGDAVGAFRTDAANASGQARFRL